jgi:hypothetical protein
MKIQGSDLTEELEEQQCDKPRVVRHMARYSDEEVRSGSHNGAPV